MSSGGLIAFYHHSSLVFRQFLITLQASLQVSASDDLLSPRVLLIKSSLKLSSKHFKELTLSNILILSPKVKVKPNILFSFKNYNYFKTSSSHFGNSSILFTYPLIA